MKAIISSTYDNNYLYFLPIVTWCWNKLGVDVVCFMPLAVPSIDSKERVGKMYWMADALAKLELKIQLEFFVAPEHKEATYAQCARLYGGCLDLPEDEVLITSDCDMAVLHLPDNVRNPEPFAIFGSDLVPDNQYPMCYASGSVRAWRRAMRLEYGATSENPNEGMYLKIRTYQEMLDSLLSEIEAEHFRGNYWGKDQETLFNSLQGRNHVKIQRAKPQTQFATRRYDRDDAYILERLDYGAIDFHMNRPGYEEKNHETIKTVLKFHYPNDDFGWLDNYRNEYLKLL